MCAASRIGALNRNGMKACTEGDLANASFLLHQALREATSLGLAGFEAKIRNNLGLVCGLSGRHDEASRHFEAALAQVETRHGRENRLYTSITNNLRALHAHCI